MMGYGMAGMGIIGMVFWTIILGLLIYGVYSLAVRISQKPKENLDRSLSLLKERLGRGEISEEDYERLKEILKRD